MAETPLDMAHAAMKATPGNDAARLRFFERISDAELFLLLREEASGGQIKPEIFETGAHRLVLAFDREER
ncbi:MAG: SseB family protein, partial [Pseudomonadota bacterium]